MSALFQLKFFVGSVTLYRQLTVVNMTCTFGNSEEIGIHIKHVIWLCESVSHVVVFKI